jgi:hypothetical protein
MIESPSTRWDLTDSVRFEVRNTISARADVASPSVARITVEVTRHNLHFMWSRHSTIRPAVLSRNATVEFLEVAAVGSVCIGGRRRLLCVYKGMEDLDSQLSRIRPARRERPVDLNDELGNVAGSELRRGDREREQRPLL